MNNYVYCHIGSSLPEYLFDSFESVRRIENEHRIILVTDNDIEIEGVEVLKVSEIASSQSLSAMKMTLFGDDPNKLWRTSIFRVFLVRDSIKYLNLDYCYHFDSDVLLFQPSKKFKTAINDFDGLYITYHNEFEVVFGFSRFGNLEKINTICDILHTVIFDKKMQIEYSSGGMPNEMRLMYGIMKNNPNLIKTLDILPNKNGIIFDPSSYGQYFGGTHQGHAPGFSHHTHIIGREIQNKKIVPFMKDKKPYVLFDGVEYPIANLHIHSKNTQKFL